MADIAALKNFSTGFFDECEQVFKRDIPFERMGGREDIAAGAAQGAHRPDLAAHVLRSAVGHRALGGNATPEGQSAPVLVHNSGDIHDMAR